VIVAFTSVLGETDPLRRPTLVGPGVRYLCFCDRPLPPAPPYEQVIYPVGAEGPALASRALKIRMDHPLLLDADVVLWHDAAFQLHTDPAKVTRTFLGATDMVAFRHPHRDRIADEATQIAKLGYAPADVLAAQVATYDAEGFTQTAITSTGYSLRRRTPAVEAFNAQWWAEVERWTYRDQMSVDYAIWKTGLQVAYIPGHYKDNPFATWHPFRPLHSLPRPLINRRGSPSSKPTSVGRPSGVRHRFSG